MWENNLDTGWTAEERVLLDQAVEFTIINNGKTDFIELASLFLSKVSDVDFTLIGQLNIQDKFQIQTLAFVQKEALQLSLVGKLEGLPCEKVFADKLYNFPFEVQKHFPSGSELINLGIDSFIGATLNDENNEPLGLLVLMNCNPFNRVAFLEALLGIFSLPLEKELRKLLAVQADI